MPPRPGWLMKPITWTFSMRQWEAHSLFAFFFGVALCGQSVTAEPLDSPLPALHQLLSGQEEPATSGPADILDEARSKVGEGDYANAAKLLSQYLVFVPDDSQARLELARVLSWDASYDESLAVYDEILAARAFESELGVERAQVLGWMGRYPEAEAAVREVLAVEPEHVDGNLLLASLLEWQGRQEEAQEVHKWLLKIDPSSQPAESEIETKSPEPGDAWQLRFANRYSGDINGFALYGSRLGLRMPVLPLFSLTPYAMTTMLDDPNSAAQWGVGGGLAIDWKVVEEVSMGIDAGALYYLDLPDHTDWQGAFKVSTAPVDWLYLAMRLHTELYGEAGQSLAALANGVRAWGGDLSAYSAYGRFEAFALLTLVSLDRPGHSSSLVTTGLVAPMVRLFGDNHRLFLGYKLWFTGHSEAAPVTYSYWSPARYLTNHLLLHVKGPIGSGGYFVEAGAGVGQEFEPAAGEGTTSPVAEHWSFFPVAQAGAGVRLPLTARLELEMGGWTTYSKRLEGATGSQYVLWFLEANLNYRWSR
mgnify:CR=1 FL=1